MIVFYCEIQFTITANYMYVKYLSSLNLILQRNNIKWVQNKCVRDMLLFNIIRIPKRRNFNALRLSHFKNLEHKAKNNKELYNDTINRVIKCNRFLDLRDTLYVIGGSCQEDTTIKLSLSCQTLWLCKCMP